MADDVNITNFGQLEAGATAIEKGIREIQTATSSVAGNPFPGYAACNPDLITSYINKLLEALKATEELANKSLAGAQELIKLKPEETEDNTQTPADTDNGNGNGNNTNPGGSNPPGGTGTPVTPPEGGDTETPPEVEDPDDIDEEPLEAVDIDTSCLRDLPLKDIDGVVDTVLGLCEDKKMYLDEYLESDDYSDELKEALLKAEFLPDDLKEQLLNADSRVVRKLIQAIMNGEFPEIFELNPLNIGAAYAYLERCASEHGITVEELLLNEEYADLLREKLQNFDGVVDFAKAISELEPDKYQDRLLEVWDGSNIEGMEDSTVDIIRDYLSYVAEQVSDESQEVTPEELLSNRDYSSVIKEATEQFAKSCVFLNAGGHMSNTGVATVVGGLFTGKNPKAMGMDSESQKKFKEEVDSFAKSKGTTTESLLSDNQYSEEVKKLLKESENAKEIGAIYDKENADVSQRVVKNLYETEITNDTSVFSYKPEDGKTDTTTKTDAEIPSEVGHDVDVPVTG